MKIEISVGLECTIERWQRLARAQLDAQKRGDDHAICENCDEQLYFCECPDRLAYDILAELFLEGDA